MAITSGNNTALEPGHRAQVFKVRGLTKVYGSGAAEARALAGVDPDLYEGELVVLPGPFPERLERVTPP